MWDGVFSVAKLYVERGPCRGKELCLEEGKTYTIGRDAGCSLSFPDNMASREHCTVQVEESRCLLTDLGSRNGTQVNGQELTKPREIKIGDQIEVGDTLISLLANEERQTFGGLVGREIAGYQIIERVGRGGMGTVYRAKQLSLGRDVAFKVLSPVLAWDKEFVQRFEDEVRAAARLVHPNIVQAYDVGHEGTIHYLTMQFMAGGTIEEKIDREGRVAPDRAVPMLIDVARGLAYAEEMGLVHRDIKPENLMLDERGTAKIVDLGIACQLQGRRSVVQSEGVFGSAHYIAPEQASGERIDGRADIYGLGASAYHMLSGRTLFRGDSPTEIMAKHVNEEPEPLDKAAPWVPRSLCRVIMKMIEKDPDDRYRSAKEVIQAFEGLGSGSPAAARPAELRHITDFATKPKTDRYKRQRRNKMIIIGIIGGLVLLLLLLFLLTR